MNHLLLLLLFNAGFYSHMYTQKFSPHMWVIASLWLWNLFVGLEKILLALPCLCVFFFIRTSSMGLSCVVHGNHFLTPYAHQWEPCIAMSIGTLYTLFFDLAPLSTTLFGFFQDHLVLWASLIRYTFVWALSTHILFPSNSKRDPAYFDTLLYATICYGTTCLGDKTLGRIQFRN